MRPHIVHYNYGSPRVGNKAFADAVRPSSAVMKGQRPGWQKQQGMVLCTDDRKLPHASSYGLCCIDS